MPAIHGEVVEALVIAPVRLRRWYPRLAQAVWHPDLAWPLFIAYHHAYSPAKAGGWATLYPARGQKNQTCAERGVRQCEVFIRLLQRAVSGEVVGLTPDTMSTRGDLGLYPGVGQSVATVVVNVDKVARLHAGLHRLHRRLDSEQSLGDIGVNIKNLTRLARIIERQRRKA